ncbi:hypothetical protein GOHSU_60_00040 [Gordonia hirsuta DSM 44140 = NBRC 16056]|uniref:Lipoprotein n=1 Tax=Gordonia hirsuta DSM 44140 = NBRC 16056 TaxID=1121927 RepID=L7LDV1_9ACTN|nr:hypothetical protein [Gordonia hirsuta]GAC58926.1 hypothetical protein GOHSU_60_00040 [Gordonia hirsuta DSM 44140 = NBRC 16056]
MTSARSAVAGALLLGCAGLLAACGSAEPAPPPTEAPPPTTGTMPWGGDLGGFGDRKQVRCDAGDQAVRMAWQGDSRFLICRKVTPGDDGTGERYLRAWTTGRPGMPNEQPPAFHQGRFYTLTDNSLQFLTEDQVKFDIGPTAVTIEWPQEPGSRTKQFSTIRTGEGWSRLD